MRTLLLTLATPNIIPSCIDFLANQLAYARTNNYEHRLVTDIHWTDLHPSFSKVWEIKRALEDGYDFVIWADADVAFLNFKHDFLELVKPEFFLAARHQTNWPDWTYICAGFIIIRNCDQSRAFLNAWCERCEIGSPAIEPDKRVRITYAPWDQWYLDEMIRETKYAGIHPCNAAEMGCFCPEIWHDGTIYSPGMPVIHMAGQASWEKRSEIFRTIYEKQVIKC